MVDSLENMFFNNMGLFLATFDLDNGKIKVKNKKSKQKIDEICHDYFVDKMAQVLKELSYSGNSQVYRSPDKEYDDLTGGSMINPSQQSGSSNTSPPVSQQRPQPQRQPQQMTAASAQQQRQPQQMTAASAQQQQPTIPPYKGAIDPNTDYSNARPGSAAIVQGVYSAARSAGFTDPAARHFVGEINRENSLNPALIYGTHSDPANHATNAGIVSYQGDRRTNLMNYLQQNGALDKNGNMIPNQANLNDQFRFMHNEMQQRNPDAFKYNTDPSVNYDQTTATNMLGGPGGYIGWAINNPKYRDSGLRNWNIGYNLANKYVPPEQDPTQVASQTNQNNTTTAQNTPPNSPTQSSDKVAMNTPIPTPSPPAPPQTPPPIQNTNPAPNPVPASSSVSNNPVTASNDASDRISSPDITNLGSKSDSTS